MLGGELEIVLRLLDDQLIDADGRRCGRVDDVELRGGAGKPTSVAALLTGAGAWPNRVPRRLAPAFAVITPAFTHRIPWDAVDDVATTVKLSRSSADLGLGGDDGRNVRWNGDPAEGWLRVSTLLGTPAVTTSGVALGRVHDLRIKRLTERPTDTVDEPWIVSGLLVGPRGLLHRFGAPAGSPAFVPWERVLEIRDNLIRVSDQA